MSLAPSKTIFRIKEGYIGGWSGSYTMAASGTTLLEYNNPAEFYLTRVMVGMDFSTQQVGDTLFLILDVDGQSLYVEKYVLTDLNIGIQPKMMEFVIPPNSLVKVIAGQSGNRGKASATLTGFRQ
jgi:hypothetical protein